MNTELNVKIIRDVEWSVRGGAAYDWSMLCPYCRGESQYGHEPNCLIATVLTDLGQEVKVREQK